MKVKVPAPGRPTRLTKVMIDRIYEIVLRSNYIDTACQSEGIARSILYDALNKGDSLYKYLDESQVDLLIKSFDQSKSQDDLYGCKVVGDKGLTQYEVLSLYLHYKLKKAEALSEIADLDTINTAAKTMWQAAAWKLERRHADRWSEKNTINVTVAQGLRVRDSIQADLDRPPDVTIVEGSVRVIGESR